MTDVGLPALAGGSVVTVGTFDGVHRGHRQILADLAARAADRALPGLVVTFTPHPLAVVNPAAAPRLLTPGAERLLEIASLPSNHFVAVVPFTPHLAALTADQFIGRVVDRYAMRELVVGYDHGLGRGRQGDVSVLRALGERMGFSVCVVGPEADAQGTAISSTAIRRAIAYGELHSAAEMLGRPYAFNGTVVPGSGRGRGIGIPTLNLVISPDKLLPPDGVYAVRASGRLGAFGGMMNLGGRPTFGEHERIPEVHLFGASGDWYREGVRVEFVSRIRDTIRFAGVAELVQQLARDAEAAHVALTQA